MGDLFPKIEELLRHAVKEIINPFYGIELIVVKFHRFYHFYGIGGHYKPHIDGESIWVTPKCERLVLSGRNLQIGISQWCFI